jgi:para-nitrobenzyl esterase
MYESDDPTKLNQNLSQMDQKYAPLIAKRLQQEPTAQHRLDVLSSLIEMVCPAYFIANKVIEAGHNAFVYRFDKIRDGSGGKALLAYHGAEIPYVFDSHDDWLPTSVDDQKLTHTMISYWSNFAKNGHPNQPDLITWPLFNFSHNSLLLLNSKIETIAPVDGYLCQQLIADY